MTPVHILLIEDNEGDIMLTLEALEDSKITNTVSVIKDGKAAVDFFDSLKTNEGAPDLVLLDVNLPRMNGHEVLRYLKSSERHKHIPVIMLTTSSSEQDIMLSYKNYVNCFITKPIEVDDFMKAIMKVEEFWISIVTLPKP